MEGRRRHLLRSWTRRLAPATAGLAAGVAMFVGAAPTIGDPVLLAVASVSSGAATFIGLAIGAAQQANPPSQAGRRRSSRPHDVFLSYMAEDRGWAEWTQEALKQAGLRICVQRWDFRPDQDLAARAEDALREAELVVVIASKDFVALAHAGATWTGAVMRRRKGRDRLLVLQVQPLELDRLEPEPDLDIGGLSPDEVAGRLVALLAQHGVEPVEPTAGKPQTGTPARFPPWGPTISNLPARNPNFTGRAELIERLRLTLVQGSSAAVVQGQAIHGLGGIGKSQIALEYSHCYASSYDLAWWVPAEQDASIANALGGLARTLGVREDAEQDEMLVALWDRLRRSGNWLLVFDNAESTPGLERYWPSSGVGHVLVTSRNPAMRGLAPTIAIPELSAGEAAAFLQKRTGTDDVATATLLAEDLGFLPLALEQAAAYLEETKISMALYRERFRERGSDVFAVGQPHAYKQTVATTWSMNLEQAKVDAPAALDLLTLCSFLAPEDIPRGLAPDHANRLPLQARLDLGDSMGHDVAVRALSRFSLIAADGETLSLHRLVQLVVRESLDPEHERTWAHVAVCVLRDAFPRERDSGTWRVRARLLPHVVTATDTAQVLGVAAEETGVLLQAAAEYLHERGQLLDAQKRFEAALAIRSGKHGERSIQVAETEHSLGRLAYHLADLTSARQHTERALALRRELLGDNHPQLADSLTHHGSVLRELTEFPEARANTEEALRIRKFLHGPDHPKVAECLHLLGIISWRQRDLPRADKEHQQARAIRETHCGADSVDVAGSLKHLGLVHTDMAAGDPAELRVAQDFFERALVIFADAYGADHPDTADLQSNLGGVLGQLGELPRARSLLEQAIATRESTVGRDHPDVAGSLTKLGSVLCELGEKASAREVLERALGIFESRYDAGHHYVADAVEALAPVVRDLGDVESADALARRGQDIRRTCPRS